MMLLKIKSDVPLTTKQFKEIDDVIRVNSNEIGIESSELHPSQEKIKLIHGETMFALGRSLEGYHPLMAAAGSFSIECIELDCHELLRVNCRISKAGIGGPMINEDGDIVVMNFYSSYCTPFLPINIILKWLDHEKRSLAFPRPQLGMQVANLCTASVGILQRVFQKFPDISSGVIVKMIEEGFDIAGIHAEDVIVECAESKVESLLQLS